MNRFFEESFHGHIGAFYDDGPKNHLLDPPDQTPQWVFHTGLGSEPRHEQVRARLEAKMRRVGWHEAKVTTKRRTSQVHAHQTSEVHMQ